MKRSWRLATLGWLAVSGVATAKKETKKKSSRSSSVSSASTSSEDGLEFTAASSTIFNAEFDILDSEICEALGKSGCATANAAQVIPIESGDGGTRAQLELAFDGGLTTLMYGIGIENDSFSSSTTDFVQSANIVCGFAGETQAGTGTVVVPLNFRANGEALTGILTESSLATNADSTVVVCDGRGVDSISVLFDLMFDGAVFLEVAVPNLSTGATTTLSYVRGQLYMA